MVYNKLKIDIIKVGFRNFLLILFFYPKKYYFHMSPSTNVTKPILNQRFPKLGSVALYLGFCGTLKKKQKNNKAQMKEIKKMYKNFYSIL